MLLGLETDYQLSGISKTTNGIETSLPWFGTTRVRAGYLMSPNFLFYGTGGVAYSSAKISDAGYSINVPGVGWVGGAGVEYAMGAGWSIGAEYLHVNLGGPSASVGVINGNAATSADAVRPGEDQLQVLNRCNSKGCPPRGGRSFCFNVA
jgi:opacity protein-like surface antigen